MVDYTKDGPTYQAVADQIMDDVPGDVPTPFLRITVEYNEDESLYYFIESHHEDRYPIDRSWESFKLSGEIAFGDPDFENVHDYLSGVLKESTGEIPLMYNGHILRDNSLGHKAFGIDEDFVSTENSFEADI